MWLELIGDSHGCAIHKMTTLTKSWSKDTILPWCLIILSYNINKLAAHIVHGMCQHTCIKTKDKQKRSKKPRHNTI